MLLVVLGVLSAIVLYTFGLLLAAIVLLRRAPDQALHKRVFYQSSHEHWLNPQFGFWHLMKVSRIMRVMRPMFQIVGCSDEEYADLLPFILYCDGGVYAADLKVERDQARGSRYDDSPVARLRSDMARLLADYGIEDKRLDEEIGRIGLLFELEDELMLRGREPTLQTLRQVCIERVQHLNVALRLTYLVRGLPYDERVLQAALNIMALAGIQEDLETYQDDLRDGTFNLVRVCAAHYGASETMAKLQLLTDELAKSVEESFGQLDNRTLARAWGASLDHISRLPYPVIYCLFRLVPRGVSLWALRSMPRRKRVLSFMPQVIAEEPRMAQQLTAAAS